MIVASFLSKGLETFLQSSFGSDEFVPYSAQYSWLANQMSHAMMGFFLAAIWAVLRRRWFWPFLVAPAKIPFDYLAAVGLATGHFKPPACEFWSDKLTDVFFWSFGMAIATAIFSTQPFLARRRIWKCSALLVVGAGASVAIGHWWVRQKQAFDDSEIPNTYVRLCNLESRPGHPLEFDPPDPVHGDALSTLDAYVESIERGAEPKMHLIIVGGSITARSDLALALGCEHTARIQLVYYTTLAKGLEDPGRIQRFLDRVAAPRAAKSCPLRCLIVDDVDTSRPPIATSDAEGELRILAFQNMVRNNAVDADSPQHRVAKENVRLESAVQKQLDELRKGYVNSIWVLSGDPSDPEQSRHINAWIRNLQLRIGSNDGPCKVVMLRTKERSTERFRAE